MKNNKMNYFLPFLTCIFCTLTRLSSAGDADNLHDVCPTDTKAQKHVFINGLPCKSPSDVTPSDFKSSSLNSPGPTDNIFRSWTTLTTAAEFPGLNTLGLSAARTDMEVGGAVGPHAHPRASEMAFVRSGRVVAGFVDSGGRVFQNWLEEGDVFLFPRGLSHYMVNAGFGGATVFSVMNSQSPGVGGGGGVFAGRVNGSVNAKEMMVMEKLKGIVGMRDLDGVSADDLFGEYWY